MVPLPLNGKAKINPNLLLKIHFYMVTKMKKLQIAYPIIVEGKYDRMKLLAICEGLIIKTDGFGIFKKQEKMVLLRALAEKTRIIVLSDSDGAGKVIRSHISSAIPKERLIQVYTPRIEGKEKRKAQASAEGYLGVEGADVKILYDILLPFSSDGNGACGCNITKLDFYNDGLTGMDNSSEKRNKVAKFLGLPADMTPNALLSAIQVAYTIEEYKSAVEFATNN